MEELGEDEVAAMVFVAITGAAFLIGWYRRLVRATWIGRSALKSRLPLALAPPVGLLIIYAALALVADPVVRNDARYLALFLLGGVVWMFGTVAASPWLGISPRIDAVERRNVAASIAIAGAMLATSIVYAAANVGAGATIWATFGPALLAWALLLVLWLIHELISRAAESITIDRDVASATHLCGVLIGAALILGHGAAGDSHSAGETFRDVGVDAMPAGVLLVLAAVVQRRLRSRAASRLKAIALASLYVAIGAAYFAIRGVPR